MRTLMTLDGVSDGRLYMERDSVKVDTGGCEGCSACCHDVGDYVALTPYDLYEMKVATQLTFDALCEKKIEIKFENKLPILYLKMRTESNNSKPCVFLSEFGRCEIHEHRPNICRLFPLGRVYEADDFKYILQIEACLKPKREKMKIKKWLEIEHYTANKNMVIAWYQLIKALQFRLKFVRDNDELTGIQNDFTQLFYEINAESREVFYDQFHDKIKLAKIKFGIL